MNQVAALDEKTLLNFAVQAQQKGMLQHAEAAYRQVLALNPNQPDALQLLGVLASQVGHHAAGEELIQKSLQINPANTNARFNLMKIYRDHSETGAFKHRYENALELFKKAESSTPDDIEMIGDIANLLELMERPNDAWPYYRKAYELASSIKNPTAEAHSILGIVKAMHGDYQASVEHHEQARAMKPYDSTALMHIADAYKKMRNLPAAEKHYLQAIESEPHIWQNHLNLGVFYWENGQLDRSLEAYNQALKMNPKSPHILTCIGMVHMDKVNFAEAKSVFEKILEIDPDHSQTHLALGNIMMSQGDANGAKQHYQRAYADTNSAIAHSNYLFIMHYDPTVTARDIYQESLKWAKNYTSHITPLQHSNDRDPERRLRVGYVSGDLRVHPVTSYLEPVMKSHDKSKVEIFCYANQQRNDEVTQRYMSYADHWRNIYQLSDVAAAHIIQEDKIDILIDLSGHTENSRVVMFARKPAPIQATWIGYFNTTGLEAMDYIITDCHLLPPEDEHLYTEKPMRLPHSGAVYQMRDLSTEVNALPALTNGYVTFGCFNAIGKLTPDVIALWAEILKQSPDSKLFLKNQGFNAEDVRESYRAQFQKHGIDASRISFAGFSPKNEYMAEYHKVDIGLDPFPYNGATTTLDSLAMGVPMVSLKGDRLIAHIGESLLAKVGLEDFIAPTKEAYIQKAVAFAKDIPKLANIRATLRQTMIDSPMTNPETFTRGLEDAFRTAWREWCSKQ